MKAALENWLLARWYGGVAPGLLLRSLACVYAWLRALREWAFDAGVFRSERLARPVIVVGNRVAGGAGKTPVVIALVRHFQQRGERVGVLSRGYGRASSAPQRVSAASTAAQCGDEPLEIFCATGALVEVDRDRVRAGKALVDAGCTLLIADDGLQHRRLARDIDIEVVDGCRGYGNGRLLPAGPLREPIDDRPQRWRLINGPGTFDQDGIRLMSTLRDAELLADPAVRQPLAGWSGQKVAAMAGIGHPQRFFDALHGIGLQVEEHPFPDHHGYESADLAMITRRPLLVTAKDAPKLRRFGLSDVWVVPLELTLPVALLDSLHQRLAEVRRGHA